MGCTTVTMKSCLGLMSLFFWLCAVGLIVIGSIILTEYGKIKELSESVDIIAPSFILIGAGVFLFIVGVLGCVGGMKGNKAALAVFFILTLIILVGEVAAVALGYHYKDKAEDALTKEFHRMVKECSMSNETSVECDEVNFIQNKMECCGSDSYLDWFNWTTAANASVPDSCCIEKGCYLPVTLHNKTIISETIHTEGCANKVVDFFTSEFEWILIGTMVVAILQVLGLIATCVLLFRSKETPYSSLDSQGYRV